MPLHSSRGDDLAGIQLVVIGASAGGVEALGVLLQALPAGATAALVAVLHIPHGRPSLLPELYAQRCALPVREAEDKEPVVAGTVYFAAPDYHLQIEPERTFSFSIDGAVNYSLPAIDVTLESAALAYGPAMLGIILTGASADGAAGLAAVRRHGGLAWVQDPQEALAKAMPAAAIARAGADRIWRIKQIAAGLSRLGPRLHANIKDSCD